MNRRWGWFSIMAAALLMVSSTAWANGADDASDDKVVIGFNNMFTDLEFFQVVEEGLVKAAEENGIELLIAYGERDGTKMMRNVETFILQGADIVLDFNVLPEVGTQIVKRCAEESIPVIGIDGIYEGAYFFGVNNEKVGRTGGTYAAQYIKDNWGGDLDYIMQLYSESAGPAVQLRNSGASDVISEELPGFDPDNVIWVDGGGHMDTVNGRALTMDFLTAHPEADHIYIQVLTDLPALGAFNAVQEAGREDQVIIISNDASGPALDNMRKPEANSWLGSVAAFPEKYGENLVDYALQILEGGDAPKAKYTDNVVIDKSNINAYYPE